MDRLYHRTPAGERALLVGASLPQPLRALLAALGDACGLRDVASRLPAAGEEHLLACLEDLEAIGLVESVPRQWLAELLELAACVPGESAGPA